MMKICSLAFVVTFILCGCQSPIVPVKNIEYSVVYSVDGKNFQVNRRYKCYYEDVAWLSERGAEWHIREEDRPIFMAGNFPDGARFIVQPVDTKMWDFFPDFRCSNNDVAIASEIFVRSKADSRNLESFDVFRTTSHEHEVRIDRSMLHLESNREGKFKLPTALNRGKSYYTVSAKILSGPEIDRAGLRDYVTSRKSIWLKAGTTIPFTGWNREDVETARKYSERLAPYLYYPNGGVELTGEYTKKTWTFTRSTSHTSITWIPADLTESEASRVPDKKLPTMWISFEDSQIEIPVAKHSALHFYNPSTNELVVFYIYKTEIPDNLL